MAEAAGVLVVQLAFIVVVAGRRPWHVCVVELVRGTLLLEGSKAWLVLLCSGVWKACGHCRVVVFLAGGRAGDSCGPSVLEATCWGRDP